MLSYLIAQHVKEVKVIGQNLVIQYHDGIIEDYSYVEAIQAWRFQKKNISIQLDATSAN